MIKKLKNNIFLALAWYESGLENQLSQLDLGLNINSCQFIGYYSYYSFNRM